MKTLLHPLALFALLLIGQRGFAANTLTAKQVQEGWLLLFDGKTTFGWKIDGEAKVENGLLVLGGKKETRAEPTTAFAECRLTFEADWSGKNTPIYSVRPGKPSPIYSIPTDTPRPVPGKGKFGAYSWERTGPTSVISSPVTFIVPAGSKLMLRNVLLRPGGQKALFNGKDLTGWKIHKGKKSKFSVTKEGWLNVKDGPGDLQTTGLYSDFVLQLECISNGKHLNSGIFFRCIPDLYQQGYEAQIRNQFTDKPTQKYKIDEYDPKTHKLLGTKTILSTAVDYGTGAIYRRMPARMGVAKDREWFTLTVVARGRHLATWVNGVQVVDWTDNRPASDNARKGYRAAAGAISIQGHDPTTDLSFRNLRIAPLP